MPTSRSTQSSTSDELPAKGRMSSFTIANDANLAQVALPASSHESHGASQRPSKSKTNKSLPRSTSIPYVREPVMSDSDKKRNKLGYQRTSMACAHCRRRKIRCLLADGDPQRCQNCIRLKKDCVFCPVEDESRLSEKMGTGTGPSSVVSSSTTPEIGTERRTFDEREVPTYQDREIGNAFPNEGDYDSAQTCCNLD